MNSSKKIVLGLKSFLQSQGLEVDAKLSPHKIKSHLQQEWHLQNEDIVQFLLAELSNRSFGEFIDRIEAAFQDMPYATRAFQTLKENNCLTELCKGINLEEGFYRLAVLETLTRKSEQDFSFFKKAYLEYSRLIAKKFSTDSKGKLAMLREGTLFTYIKYLTIDSSIRFRFQIHETPDGIESFRRKRLTRFFMLPLNVIEASITDAFHGHMKNAFAGLLLASSPLNHYDIDFPNRKILLHCRPGYEEAYLLWNLTFCLRKNSSQVHRVIPKLLFPQILQDRSSDFINSRSISLWYSLQTIFLAEDQALASEYKELTETCAQVIGQEALRATIPFKNQKKFEFIRNMYSFHTSEKKLRS